MTEFSDHEKALMLDMLIDQMIHNFESIKDKKPKDIGYHSVAEMNGYEFHTMLDSNGFVTNKGIEGK